MGLREGVIMTFAERLKEVRQQKGMTQAALADASGISLGAVRDYEQGKRDPLLPNAKRLAVALGVSIDLLAETCLEAAPKKPRGRGKK